MLAASGVHDITLHEVQAHLQQHRIQRPAADGLGCISCATPSEVHAPARLQAHNAAARALQRRSGRCSGGLCSSQQQRASRPAMPQSAPASPPHPAAGAPALALPALSADAAIAASVAASPAGQQAPARCPPLLDRLRWMELELTRERQRVRELEQEVQMLRSNGGSGGPTGTPRARPAASALPPVTSLPPLLPLGSPLGSGSPGSCLDVAVCSPGRTPPPSLFTACASTPFGGGAAADGSVGPAGLPPHASRLDWELLRLLEGPISIGDGVLQALGSSPRPQKSAPPPRPRPCTSASLPGSVDGPASTASAPPTCARPGRPAAAAAAAVQRRQRKRAAEELRSGEDCELLRALSLETSASLPALAGLTLPPPQLLCLDRGGTSAVGAASCSAFPPPPSEDELAALPTFF